jgi:uncharacterized protein YjbJ (UPF0337 family)
MVELIDKVAGTLKEAIGKLRSDKKAAAGGKAEGTKGPAQGAAKAAKPEAKGAAQDAAKAAKPKVKGKRGGTKKH